MRYNYDDIMLGAERGNPHDMILRAKLSRAMNEDYDEYIFWLDRFMKSPEVVNVIGSMEEAHNASGFKAKTQLEKDVIEAMCCLYLYFRFDDGQRAKYIPPWFSFDSFVFKKY